MTDADLFDAADRETFRRAIEAWGLDAQVDMAVEECNELSVALLHHRRGRATRAAVIEELADIRIMYEQLRWYFGADWVDPVVESKLARLRDRLPDEEAPPAE